MSTGLSRRKRRLFVELNKWLSDDEEFHQPRKKKQKLRVQSELFSNYQDRRQFVEIYEAIEQSQMVKTLQTPPDILKLLAEYSMGCTHRCSNLKCKSIICTLFEDKDKMRSDLLSFTHIHREAYKYSSKSGQYFCFRCMDNAVRTTEMYRHPNCLCDFALTHCCCHYLQYIPDCHECNQCHYVIPKLCGCDSYVFLTNWECKSCGTKQFVCKDCAKSDVVECDECLIEFDKLFG